MLAIPFALLLAVTLTGAGRPFVLRLDEKGRLSLGEQLVVSALIGALLLHFAVQAVGHARFDQNSMALVGAVLLAMSWPGLRTLPWKDLVRQLAALPRAALLLLLGLCLLSFLQGLAPPNDYDSLMYHLATPKTDLERGKIAPDWMRGLPNAFFPHLVTSLVRFSLSLVGEKATQPVVAVLGLIGVGGTGLLARRIGLSPFAALLAAAFFICVRMNIWELGTVEVDLPLATATTAAVLVLLAGRPAYDRRMMILLGLMLGVAFNIKYQGGLVALALAPLLLLDWLRRRVDFWGLTLMGVTALGVFAPHLLENFFLTGDPVFPLYFSKIRPGGAIFYDFYHLTYGTGRDLLDLLIEPWLIFAAPMQYFDGMILGAPYLLALAPASIIGWRRLKDAASLVAVIAVYYLLWFYMQSQQVRFLAPVFPLLSVLAAAGAVFLWESSRIKSATRLLAVCLFTLMLANQSLFVGIYAALRLPVALGLMSPADYHARTPTLGGANFPTCRYLGDTLPPQAWYLSLLTPHSYYCPQLGAIQRVFPDEPANWLWVDPPHKIDFPDFVHRFEVLDIRFVIVPVSIENRRNDTGEPVFTAFDFDGPRFGPFIGPALDGLVPAASETRSAVYDGRQVLVNLKKMLESGTYPQEAR